MFMGHINHYSFLNLYIAIFLKSSIIDIRLSSEYASGKLSFNSYSKVRAFLRIALFRFFSQKNPYTAKTIQCKRKMISKNIITDTVKRTFKKLQEDFVLRSQEKQIKCQ